MVPPKDLAHFTHVRDGNTIFVFGEVDIATAQEFEAVLDDAAVTALSLAVDFTGCHYLDSSGLAALTRIVKRHPHVNESIVTEGSNIARLMNITAFEQVLPINYVPRLRRAEA